MMKPNSPSRTRALKVLCAGAVLTLLPFAAAAEEGAIPAAVTDLVDSHFTQFQEERHVPGMVWGIVKDGELVYLKTSGLANRETGKPVDADSLFRIASMSKAFTALAILKLRDEGRLYLDAPAEYYVPELRDWTYPTTDSPRIRVRDLLSHVAGFVTDDPWGDRQQDMTEEAFTEILKQGVPFSGAPQTKFEYSNFGYALLGRIVTNVSGMPFDDYIVREIMQPLGMDSTGYDVFAADQDRRALGYRWEEEAFSPEPTLGRGVFGAMGGVQTSANDYAKWVAFLLDAWPPRDGEETGPVKRATVRELSQGLGFQQSFERPGLAGMEPCNLDVVYAKGFSAIADCELGFTMTHSGGYPGYGSNVLLLPDQGIGIFGFANRTYAAPSGAVREAALELKQAGLLPGRTSEPTATLSEFYAIAGAVYEQGLLAPADGRLAMNFLLDRSVPVRERELAALKDQAGACGTDVPITPTGALSGTFSWTCEKGTIQGRVLLAPTTPPTFQAIDLRFTPAP